MDSMMSESDDLSDKRNTSGSSGIMSSPENLIHYRRPSQTVTMYENRFSPKLTENVEASSQKHTQLTKAELRKSNKPIMEKKRRARINHCLNELKTLILEAMKKDPARHTKLEKADILEMTVRYLQTLQRSPTNLNVPNEAVTLHRFKDGFSDCTNEVSRYINEIDGVDVNVKKRLMGHLSNCVTRIQHSTPTHTPAPDDSLNSFPFRFNESPSTCPNNMDSSWSPMCHQMPTNLIQEKNDVQFIPSRLSSGELALIIPNSVNLNYFPVASFSLNQLSNSVEAKQSTSFGDSSLKSKSMDTSPPLSPTSSISSSDSTSKRTKLQFPSLDTAFQTPQKPSNFFPISASATSSFRPFGGFYSAPKEHSTPTLTLTSLQQQHVTSTTEQVVGKCEEAPKNWSNPDNGNNSMWRPW